ncbi:MAG: nucleoid-associated protein YbaB/EbfC family [Bacteroidetes bacterium]|nr:nucleoid-associated protein YbaB/EbfC family [Bacteroidota bacterium]
MGKLQEAKKIAEEIKTKLDNTLLTSESAGGDIKIEITGNRKVIRVSVAPALQHGDKQQLEEHLLKAMNQAIGMADKIHEEEMKKVAGGLMPGLF